MNRMSRVVGATVFVLATVLFAIANRLNVYQNDELAAAGELYPTASSQHVPQTVEPSRTERLEAQLAAERERSQLRAERESIQWKYHTRMWLVTTGLYLLGMLAGLLIANWRLFQAYVAVLRGEPDTEREVDKWRTETPPV